MELLIVANPVSGGGRAGRAATLLAEMLSARRHRVELLLTRHAGHGAERLAGGPLPERVVAVGGDGTVNEIANGLLDRGDDGTRRDELPAIAVLPTGTANVLARELTLPDELPRAAKLVERGRTVALDVGHLGRAATGERASRRFLCMAGVGFDGLVTRLVAERRTGTQGFAAYTAPIWRALRDYRPPSLRVTIDDRDTLAGGWVLVSMVRNYGGLFTLADRARPGSGRFEVLVLRDASRTDVVRLALAGLRGGATSLRGVSARRGSSVRIEATAAGADVQLDGDWSGSAPVELELLPAALEIVVP